MGMGMHAMISEGRGEIELCTNLPGRICTGIGYKVVPRLRESRLLAPSGHGGEFTHPRAHLLADPCRCLSVQFTLTIEMYEEASQILLYRHLLPMMRG